MATVGTQAINPALYKSLPAMMRCGTLPRSHSSPSPPWPSLPCLALKANNLAELVALAKSMPGKLNYGSAGPVHCYSTAEMFKSVAGIDVQHVPYKGSAPAVTDLLGGQI